MKGRRLGVAGALLAAAILLAAPQALGDGRGRYAMDGETRAGHPQTVSRWAVPTETRGSSFGWVGGSTLLPGEPRNIPTDGVWGFDYQGRWLPRRIWLGWSHGGREQGGAGAYRTDGPPLKPWRRWESHEP